jgi:hypothetical protein
MAQNTDAVVIVDSHGRVLGAQLAERERAAKSKDHPSANFVPLTGQRTLRVSLPIAILSLQGPDLHRYFSEVRLRPDGKFELPKIRVAEGHSK